MEEMKTLFISLSLMITFNNSSNLTQIKQLFLYKMFKQRNSLKFF